MVSSRWFVLSFAGVRSYTRISGCAGVAAPTPPCSRVTDFGGSSNTGGQSGLHDGAPAGTSRLSPHCLLLPAALQAPDLFQLHSHTPGMASPGPWHEPLPPAGKLFALHLHTGFSSSSNLAERQHLIGDSSDPAAKKEIPPVTHSLCDIPPNLLHHLLMLCLPHWNGTL